MSIVVKFFASLREQFGKSQLELESTSVHTVLDAWNVATENSDMTDNILMAVNMEYVDATQTIHDGDEVAFFPPVTGG